ncbi:ATP synthase subunit I [Gordonia sp. LSe1-13]|uniref:ATP synthase subunit I n=2 Tax=Gordonia TaxID=2053 RepID=A0ABU7M6J5_9ACTN|nr:ATP synthase subunit I [Gordonia sp. LSe1-13]MEE4022546.1 ATP synthase subunit I [Gordonia sp. PKS22-38]
MTTSAPDSAPVYPVAPTGLKRPAIIAAVLSTIVAVVAVLIGHPLFAVFFAVGVVGVLINAKMVALSVSRVAAEENPRKKLLAVDSAVRLGAITLLALAAAFLVRPDGLGVMFGLALGQVVLVLNAVIPVMKGLRKQL